MTNHRNYTGTEYRNNLPARRRLSTRSADQVCQCQPQNALLSFEGQHVVSAVCFAAEVGLKGLEDLMGKSGDITGLPEVDEVRLTLRQLSKLPAIMVSSFGPEQRIYWGTGGEIIETTQEQKDTQSSQYTHSHCSNQ